MQLRFCHIIWWQGPACLPSKHPSLVSSCAPSIPMSCNYNLTSSQRRLLSPANVSLYPECASIDGQQCTAKIDLVPCKCITITRMSLYLRLLYPGQTVGPRTPEICSSVHLMDKGEGSCMMASLHATCKLLSQNESLMGAVQYPDTRARAHGQLSSSKHAI